MALIDVPLLSRRALLRVMGTGLLVPHLSSCGDGSSFPSLATRIGTPFAVTPLVLTDAYASGGFSSTSTALAPGIPFGLFVIRDANLRGVLNAQPFIKGVLPAVDFSIQSLICYSVVTGLSSLAFNHVSAQQVVVQRWVNCGGVGVPASASLVVLVALVEGIVRPDAALAFDSVC